MGAELEGGVLAMARQLYEYHARLGYRFIPGLKARVQHEAGGFLVRVNNCGFRCDHDFVIQKNPGVRRALLFGDTFTAGDGVSNPQRYGDLLEQEIPQLEVYNFGLPGSGTDQHYLAWQEYGANLECDVVILAVLVENIRRVTAKYRQFVDDEGQPRVFSKPYFELAGDDLVLRNVPPEPKPLKESDLPESERALVDQGGRFPAMRKLVRGLGMQKLAQKAIRYQPLPEYDDANTPAWLLMRRLLEDWIGHLQAPVILMPLPLPQHIEETCDASGYQARFAEVAASTGCALHDPLPTLRAYPREEREKFRFEKDVHLTPSGHRALALSLAPAVQQVLQQVPQEASR
jgi:hypothetical protein